MTHPGRPIRDLTRIRRRARRSFLPGLLDAGPPGRSNTARRPRLLRVPGHRRGGVGPASRGPPAPGQRAGEGSLMFRLDLGHAPGYCDGLTRRSFLRLGVAGMASVSLPRILEARAAAVDRGGPRKDTAVILIWLDGGPSHLDLYDMKPEAPAEYRGPWRPIRTCVPGIDITEMFPRQAKVADKFSLVRSLHHDTGDHFAAGHRMLTTKDMGVSGANTTGRFPSIGAVVNRQLGPRQRGMPGYIAVPHASSI